MLRARGLVAVAALTMVAACGSDVVRPALSSPDAAGDGASDAGRPTPSEDAAPTDVTSSEVPPDVSPSSPDAGGMNDAPALNDRGREDGGSTGDATNTADGGAMRCNGHEALCDRRLDEVVFPATHNAMANADDAWFGPNQEHGLARQLQDGIRAMLLDTYPFRGDLYLCHSLCDLGNRLLVDGLRDIATFLRASPNEVVALLIEDHISAAETERAFMSSGLIELVYAHPSGAAWPTLRTLITSGRRVLVTAESGRPPPAWYHHLWDLASDTPYTFRNTGEFSCQANRGKPDNALYLLNHWVENPLPSAALSRTANARDVLLQRAKTCQMQSGKLPNFVAVNHYATGDLFAVVRELNRLPP